ncbi:MAG: glycosyltransferase [Deltaproteobacteria bacterium]|nr:glycosyltransferase [Deltaproteobacteria bacterium]
MNPGLRDYDGIALPGDIRAIERLSERLRGRRFLHVNSTAVGGGVAELLQRMVPLMRELGVDAIWKVFKGTQPFFDVTKRIHNSLQGQSVLISKKMWETYEEVNAKNAKKIDTDGDCVFIHDPQPAMLIDKKKGGNWVWRCHIDISSPDRGTWYLLKRIVDKYDAAIFSVASFAQALPQPQFIIPPSIDPLSEKNIELSEGEVSEVYEKFGVPRDMPVLLQVSRFDRFKDPVGVIAAFKSVRKYHKCRLVLAGGSADDDPEGAAVLEEVMAKTDKDPDIHVLLLPPFSDRDINALQSGADIVIQKSTKEGFGLVVAEALWKRKPVIAGDVGGIPLQVINGTTGYLVRSVEGTAYRIRQLLENPKLGLAMGEAAREHMRRNFLITTHIKSYLALWVAMEHRDSSLIYL